MLRRWFRRKYEQWLEHERKAFAYETIGERNESLKGSERD